MPDPGGIVGPEAVDVGRPFRTSMYAGGFDTSGEYLLRRNAQHDQAQPYGCQSMFDVDQGPAGKGKPVDGNVESEAFQQAGWGPGACEAVVWQGT